MSALKQYNLLLNTGDLLEMYPQLVGKWKEDKDTFTDLYEENLQAIREIDVDFDVF